MKLYSTKNKAFVVDLERAIMEGLPPDNGFPEILVELLPLDFITYLALALLFYIQKEK